MFAIKRYAVGALLILLVVLGVYFYGHYQYRSGKSAAQAEQYLADLEQFKKQVGELHEVSVAINQASTQLQITLMSSIKEYQYEATLNPLPADCVMSDGRVRSINDIISEAASARESSRAVPSSSATKK